MTLNLLLVLYFGGACWMAGFYCGWDDKPSTDRAIVFGVFWPVLVCKMAYDWWKERRK